MTQILSILTVIIYVALCVSSKKFDTKVRLANETILGRTSVLLDSSSCNIQECNVGNMVADALVLYMAAQYTGPEWTDTPIGFINGGSIQNSIQEGNITVANLMEMLPTESLVISLTLNGSDLIRTLELAVANYSTSGGQLRQVSGLRTVYDLSQPSNSRVVSVKVRCSNCTIPSYEPLAEDALYKLVTVTLLTGEENSYVFGEGDADKREQGFGVVDAVAWYLSTQSPVYPEVEGRIQFSEADDDGNPGSAVALKPVTLLIILGSLVMYKHFMSSA